MAFVNFNGATQAVRLDDPKLAEFAFSSTGGAISWTWLSSGGDEIATIGQGFQFVGVVEIELVVGQGYIATPRCKPLNEDRPGR
jgi:hypothetical protein